MRPVDAMGARCPRVGRRGLVRPPRHQVIAAADAVEAGLLGLDRLLRPPRRRHRSQRRLSSDAPMSAAPTLAGERASAMRTQRAAPRLVWPRSSDAGEGSAGTRSTSDAPTTRPRSRTGRSRWRVPRASTALRPAPGRRSPTPVSILFPAATLRWRSASPLARRRAVGQPGRERPRNDAPLCADLARAERRRGHRHHGPGRGRLRLRRRSTGPPPGGADPRRFALGRSSLRARAPQLAELELDSVYRDLLTGKEHSGASSSSRSTSPRSGDWR